MMTCRMQNCLKIDTTSRSEPAGLDQSNDQSIDQSMDQSMDQSNRGMVGLEAEPASPLFYTNLCLPLVAAAAPPVVLSTREKKVALTATRCHVIRHGC